MAVPIGVIAERKVARHFLEEGATSRVNAIPFAPTHIARERAFERLKGLGIINTDGNGGTYLDEGLWNERSSSRRTRALFALLVVAAAGVFAALQ